MWHSIFIGVHAAAGAVAFGAGLIAVRTGAGFRTYLSSMITMAVALVAAIAVTWGELDPAARILFAAFVVLAGFMVWRSILARRLVPVGGAGPSGAYFAHLGFNLVALFDAFLVITVLNLGAPTPAVAGSGVLVAIAGHFVLRTAHRRLVRTDDEQPSQQHVGRH